MAIRIPAYIPFMAAVTAAYLTVEIPFSVHLVDILGGNPSQADIDRMESFGRVLTGIAVSIWIVGALILPRMHNNHRPFMAALIVASIVTCIATSATYMVLEQIAHSTGSGASGAERKEAFIANLARRHIAENGGSGDLAATGLNDWNTFVAVAPMISVADSLSRIAGAGTEEIAREEARRALGTPEQFREKVFGSAFDSVSWYYNQYKEGSQKYLEAKTNLKADAEKAWNDFQAELRRQYPDGLPGRGWTHAMIVRKVKFEWGIPVDQNWSIRDKAGFIRPYIKMASEKIEKAYRSKIELALGEGAKMAPGLDMDGFVSHPKLQKDIRSRLRLPEKGPTITPNMSDKDFLSAVYQPKLAEAEKNMVNALHASESEFEGFGDYSDYGVDAVKSARLPAMAILLSIAGAALHIFKFSGYAIQIVGHATNIRPLAAGKLRLAFATAVTAGIFVTMASSGNGVTETRTYADIKDDGIYASLLHGAIAIQPQFSQIGTFLGNIGGWQAFAADMPAPVHTARSSASAPVETASESGKVQTSSGLVFPDVSKIPLPTFRDSL